MTDKINIVIENHPYIRDAVKNNLSYICAETLAESFILGIETVIGEKIIIEEIELTILITKARDGE